MRSPTAADMASSYPHIKADFAGLSNDADELVSSEHIDWADKIFVMERRQKKRLGSLFPRQLKNTPIVCLDVPDKFEFDQPELRDLLQIKLKSHFSE